MRRSAQACNQTGPMVPVTTERRHLVVVRVEPRLFAEALTRALESRGVDVSYARVATTPVDAAIGIIGAGLSHRITAPMILELNERGTAARLHGSHQVWILGSANPVDALVAVVVELVDGQ